MDGIKEETGENRKFSTGAERQFAKGKGTPVLIPADALMEVAKHFENATAKYKPRNWEAGIPLSEILNSLLRHIYAEMMGDESERHDRAVGWNSLVYLATKERIKKGLLPKELDDTPKYQVLKDEKDMTNVEVKEELERCGIDIRPAWLKLKKLMIKNGLFDDFKSHCKKKKKRKNK